MNKLKAHNSLKKHIDTLQKITAENEILKYTIATLQEENAKLKQELSVPKNKNFFKKISNNNNNIQKIINKHYNNNNLYENLHENNNNLYENLHENNNNLNENNNNLYENNENNEFYEEINNDEINRKYGNNVKKFLDKYNINQSLEKTKNKNNKVQVPKLLFILYKKKSI